MGRRVGWPGAQGDSTRRAGRDRHHRERPNADAAADQREPALGRRGAMSRQRGFALIAVLLVLAMLGVLGAEFAYSMRLEATSVRAYKDTLTAAHLAEAAVEQGIREIAGDGSQVVMAEDGNLTFYNRARLELKRLPRVNVPLGIGQFSYRITDEEARLNLNTSPPDRVDRLLQALEIDK